MAAINGNTLRLLIDDVAIDCETSSSITISAESLEARCKTSGSWSEFIEGGIKSGEISFEGIYQQPSSNSAFDIAEKVGGVYPFIFGGTDAGDQVITGNFFLASAEISASLDEIVTFSGSGNISGEPTFGTVTT